MTLTQEELKQLVLPFDLRVEERVIRLIKLIGSGSFGVVYEGEDVKAQKRIAVKLESMLIPKGSGGGQLRVERRVLQRLEMEMMGGVPKFIGYSCCGELGVTAMTMELLGPSIEDLFDKCNRRFGIKTVLLLADQMIGLLQSLHSMGIVYRDVKPDNFVMGVFGTPKEDRVYLVDFGLCKMYRPCSARSSFGGRHIQFKTGQPLTGTQRYCSINVHKGRRDDMEALGYVFLYLLKGKLPWQGVPAQNAKQKSEKIAEMKMSITVKELCQGLPEEFEYYINHTRRLEFEEPPMYDAFRFRFRCLFRQLGYAKDYAYDWKTQTPASSQSG